MHALNNPADYLHYLFHHHPEAFSRRYLGGHCCRFDVLCLLWIIQSFVLILTYLEDLADPRTQANTFQSSGVLSLTKTLGTKID